MRKLKISLGTVLLLFLFICSFMFTAEAAVLDNGECSASGTVIWNFYEDGTLIIDGEGEMLSYTEFSQVPYGKYFENEEVKKVVIADGITQIGDYAFCFCSAETIELPVSLKKIGSYSFYGMSKAQNITLPQNLKSVGECAFSSSELLSIKVSEGSAYFCSDEKGVLYTYNKDELIFYPAVETSDEYTMPDTVTKIREGAFYGAVNLKSITLSKNLTEIGKSAFKNCTGLDNLVLPYSIRKIDRDAFAGCSNLKSVYYYSDEEALSYVETEESGLEKEEIICNYCNHSSPETRTGVTATCALPGYNEALYCSDCNAFVTERKITVIPHKDGDGDKICDECSGEYCSAVTSGFCCDAAEDVYWVLYDNGTIKICGSGKMKDYAQYASPFDKYFNDIELAVISDGVTYIGSNAFYEQGKLKKIIASDTLTAVGEGAFENCRALGDITGLTSLTEVGDRAFKNCVLSIFDFGNKLRYIGKEAFYGCRFEEVKLLSSAEKTGERSFYFCENLTQVTIGENVKEIGENAFGYCNCLKEFTVDSSNPLYTDDEGILFDKGKTRLIRYPSALSSSLYRLPETVREIAPYAFSDCKSIEQVIFNDALTVIGDYAFSSCSSLSEAELPYGTLKIGDGAFSYCSSLLNVYLTDTVNTIGSYAFNCCNQLRDIVLPDGLEKISEGTFYRCSKLEKVTVGTALKEIEKSAFSLCKSLKIVLCGKMLSFDGISVCQTDNTYFNSAPKHFESHKITSLKEQSPVCVYDGYTAGTYCSECNFYLTGHQVLKAEYTEHSLGEYREYKKSDCNEKGEERAYCTRCDYYISRETEKREHIFECTETVISDCINKGYTVYSCVCGAFYYADFTDATGHSMGNYYTVTASTCKAMGKEKSECIKCGYSQTRPLSFAPHSYSENFTADIEASCIYEGSKSRHCINCGIRTEITSVAKKSHTKNTVFIPSAINCDGSRKTVCNLCNKAFSSQSIYAISSVKLAVSSYTYDGKRKTPAVTVKDRKGNKLVKDRDYTVKYQSGRKKTGIYTVTVTFKGNYYGKKVLTFKILPTAVKSFTAKASTKSVTLSWKNVKGATGYRIYYYNTETKKYTAFKDTQKLTYTVRKLNGKELKYGTDYKFAVKAYKEINGEKLLSKKMRKLSAVTKPTKATLKKVSSSSGKATVQWKKQSCDGYELVYAANKSFSSAVKITLKKSSVIKYTVRDVPKGKTCYFKVRAYKISDGKKVCGYYSNVKTVKVK